MSKQKQAKGKPNLPVRPAGGMAMAAHWPVYDVLVAREWDTPGNLCSILIARRSPNSGKVAAGHFLVDLACLGVKSAQVKLFKDATEYADGLREHALGLQPMAPASFNLAAKILRAGVAYAAALGFKPDPIFAQAEPLLAGARPDAEPTPVPTGGPDGKPFYIDGPNDDPDRVIAQLRRAVGDDGFQLLIRGDRELAWLPDNIRVLTDEEER